MLLKLSFLVSSWPKGFRLKTKTRTPQGIRVKHNLETRTSPAKVITEQLPGRSPGLWVNLLAGPSRLKKQWSAGGHRHSQLRGSEGISPSSLFFRLFLLRRTPESVVLNINVRPL